MSENQCPVLAVDLDGTLMRSDALFESFWSALSANWRTLPGAVLALRQGRARMKRYLADRAQIDVTSLPYSEAVLDRLRTHRAQGGRVVLVTATDQDLAERIGAHLGLFDEIHGSDGQTNLKGHRKAAFLNGRYGAGQYDYMGDSAADLEVWPHARRAITVNAPPALRAAAEKVNPQIEHMTAEPPRLQDHLKALRPHQWLKNTLVFLPVLAAHALAGPELAASTLGFVSFCLIASSVYVINDLLDLAADRQHPRKRRRPFASGRIPIAHGTWMAGGLLLGGFGIAAALGGTFLLVMLGYYGLTTAYSMWLKRRAVVDICVLAGLYTVRIIAGGAAAGLPLSVWILAFSIFLFFALAAVKRQAELVDMAQRGKLTASGRGYTTEDLPVITMMALASGYVSVLVSALYVNAPATVAAYGQPEALWGICCVLLYWISRTVLLAHRGQMHDDPVVYAAKDRISRICLLLILGFIAAALVF
ncbi:UbiA family prenyltransferase [Rhodovulum visakhapatnamense]|uniref:4-hydroxybenzoate polyprenyltransferase n=1 Tax=Rhodovulum visakhapatnamense TaxID=364297 RepID=A0A4R8FD24_9RHOB|nr:UbiA family prenyltransferase [Rhodovulum visakhapatnamense]TDX21588.1 4-hydroxybenzoate polyprenyltransferase [Rhodovulum visakhapatnamense]